LLKKGKKDAADSWGKTEHKHDLNGVWKHGKSVIHEASQALASAIDKPVIGP
jgi:hypothetical protein